MWKYILLGLGVAAYYGKQKLDQLFEGLSYEPANVDFYKNGLGLISTRFTFNLRIFNKSNVPVPIQSISGMAYSNGNTLANFNVQKAATIPANGSIKLPIDITASNFETLKFIITGVIQRAVPAIQLKGGVFTVLGTAPLDVNFDKIQILPVK